MVFAIVGRGKSYHGVHVIECKRNDALEDSEFFEALGAMTAPIPCQRIGDLETAPLVFAVIYI
jgi:hypothetical protein